MKKILKISLLTLVGSTALMAAQNIDLKQTLYYGGDIITMEGDKANYVEALIEREGKIIYTDKKADAVNNFAGKMVKIDLKGKTMMPGFIEPHLHPSIAAIMLLNDTIVPHDWTKPDGVSKVAKTPQEYQKLLKVSIDNNAKEGEMHFIWGYHQL